MKDQLPDSRFVRLGDNLYQIVNFFRHPQAVEQFFQICYSTTPVIYDPEVEKGEKPLLLFWVPSERNLYQYFKGIEKFENI